VSLALAVLGAALYIWAYVEMEALRTASHDPSAPIFAGYVRFVRLMQLSYVGLGAVCLGIIVAIGAAMHARRKRAE
jgi:hypothetical protein